MCDCMRCTNGLPGCNQTPAMSSLFSPQFDAVLDFVTRCGDRDFRNVLDNILTQRRMAVQDGAVTPTSKRADYLTRLDDLSVMVNGGTL